MDKKILLGVGMTDAGTQEVLEYILKGLKNGVEKYYIVTPNPEILVYASKHDDFKSILNNARLACPDGIGVIWAGKILGKNFRERITGVDLMEKLCQKASEQPITVGFLGGEDKIAERTAECLRKKYPGLKILLAEQGNPDQKAADLVKEKILGKNFSKKNKNNRISVSNNIKLDLLFVAFGFPKQEEWMAKYVDQLPVKVMMGVGGAFDYLSGNLSRAPVWVRNLGFEWLYRLIRQPWRLKRQLSLAEFIWLVLKEKLRF